MIGHGFRACSFKNKKIELDVHTFGNQQGKKTEHLDEISQQLVLGALNATKKIRKAGADIFANFGLDKT